MSEKICWLSIFGTVCYHSKIQNAVAYYSYGTFDPTSCMGIIHIARIFSIFSHQPSDFSTLAKAEKTSLIISRSKITGQTFDI